MQLNPPFFLEKNQKLNPLYKEFLQPLGEKLSIVYGVVKKQAYYLPNTLHKEK